MKAMISSDYEWRLRLNEILRKRLKIDRDRAITVTEEILDLINQDKSEQRERSLNYHVFFADDEAPEEKFEFRQVRLQFRIALVQLLALLVAVLLLKG